MRHTHNEIIFKGRGRPVVMSVSESIMDEVQRLINKRIAEERSEYVDARVAFPALFDKKTGPGLVLAGARLREEMTQVQLAKKLGIQRHHISEMEHGKRPIGKAMAKRLASILRADYRVFL